MKRGVGDFKVADTYHQRFWNQVGRWVMRLPMSVQGQFVSIDSGKLVYQPGEPIAIRSRLRNAQGEPAKQLTVEAIVTDVGGLQPGNETAIGKVIAVVPLIEEAAIAGLYSGQIRAPAAGNYHVTIVAPGLTNEALAIHSEFAVAEPDSGEMDQLNCDETVLRKLAEITRGQYLSEAEAGQLVDLLRPLSRGRIVRVRYFAVAKLLVVRAYRHSAIDRMVAEKTSGVNMSASLEKVTSERLEQFRRRWQTLEGAQGIAVALLLALAALLLVVMIDAALVVPQAIRWLLSLVIYGALVSCLIVTYWRVTRNKNDRATARRFEDLNRNSKSDCYRRSI